jgi:hypothetical protein
MIGERRKMKVTMVIPSYWARESNIGWQPGDGIYDHPTPLDKEGTLLKALKSVAVLEDKNFQLVVLAIPTASDIAKLVEEKVAGIIKSAGSTGVEMLVFGGTHLGKIHDLLRKDGQDNYVNLLELGGYSNVRNLCTFVPHILGERLMVK